MARRKSNPIKPASLDNPNPDYVFPIPEANKILGNAYTVDGQNNLERTNARMLREKKKGQVDYEDEQFKFAAQDIRVGREYLSGRRNAFNVQRELHKKNEYIPDLYQPYMDVEHRVAKIDTYDWTHQRIDNLEWSGNFVHDVMGDFYGTFADNSPIPVHLQTGQFRKYTKEEDAAGLVVHKQPKVKGISYGQGWVTNADYHKNVEQAYKQGSMNAPKAPKAPKASKKPKEETGEYPQLSLF